MILHESNWVEFRWSIYELSSNFEEMTEDEDEDDDESDKHLEAREVDSRA